MPRLLAKKLHCFAASLWNDTRGAMLPYVTIMLVVIVGVSVLALDGARLMSLHSQIQKGTDALALAAAAELDRRHDSITRANLAIQNLVTNSSVFGTGGNANVTVSSVRFLRSLPSTDADQIGGTNVICSTSCTEADAVEARFVEVTASPITLAAILPAAFFGGSATSTAGATAVAGNEGVVCKFIPMYICNPYETSGMTDGEATQALTTAAADPNILRRLIQLKNDSSYGPGNYGFLNTSLGNGAQPLKEAIARVNPGVCLLQSGVDTQPGSINAIDDAFNVRFDMYKGSMSGNKYKGNSEYRPGQNVRKGFACTSNVPNDLPDGPPPYLDALPLDATWPHMNGRMGDGVWDLPGYWAAVHPTHAPPAQWATTLPSRYEVYLYEVANNLMSDVYAGNGLSGTPACYTGGSGTLSDTPDRRILHVAIVNCGALALNGNQTDVPVAAFGKFFLTHPVKQGVDQTVYAEMVGLAEPGGGGGGSGGIAADMVQLVR